MNAARDRPAPWLQRALPVLLGLGAIYVAPLPLAPGHGAAMPDLLYCLVIAFTLRAPRALPGAVVLALGLAADLMLARPPGLGALGLYAASAVARAPGGGPRGWPLWREWLAAAALFALMIAAEALILKLAFLDPPGPLALRRHLIATVLAYPLVALGVGWLTSARRRAAPGAAR